MPIASGQASSQDSFSHCHPAGRLRDPKQQQRPPAGGGDSGGGGGGGGLLPFPICLNPSQAEPGAEAAAATSREAGLSSRLLASSSPQHPALVQVTPSFSSPSSFFQALSSASSPPSSPLPPAAPSFLFPAFLEPPRTRSRSRSGFIMNHQQQQLHGMPGVPHFHHPHQLQTPPPPPPHLISAALRGPGMDRNDNSPPEGARQPHSPPVVARRRVNSPTTNEHHHHHYHHLRPPPGRSTSCCTLDRS